jgi:putative transposase
VPDEYSPSTIEVRLKRAYYLEQKKGYPKFKKHQTNSSVEYKTSGWKLSEDRRFLKRLSRKQKGSKNRIKARGKLGRKHLRVSRQRKDFAVKLARCVVKSSDLVSDASWSLFRQWIEYFGKVFGVVTIAVPPHYTSQNCSSCGEVVRKTLSTRTHQCPHCGYVADRDENAARNILLCLGDESPPSKSARGKRKQLGVSL